MENFEKGIALFNEGLFFEAHEAWESDWFRAGESPEKHFLQGMIMIAAAFHHYRRREHRGTGSLLERGVEILNEHGTASIAIDKERFLKDLLVVSEKIHSGSVLPESDFPKIVT